MQEHSNAKPTTHQGDLTKLPRALKPLIEKPQWVVWKWTQQSNGRWQKPPYQALDPRRHASTKDSGTWADYTTALATVQAGDAEGVSFVMTPADPFAAIDLDHCRDPDTHSIATWAQNFLDVCRDSYSEVTPSGEGCRIWGLTAPDTEPVNRKFTLEIDGKPIAAEPFRHTSKVLTVTGYQLNTIRELANIDRAFQWTVVWGERRKAAEAVAATQIDSFNGGGPGHDIDHIEKIVREGAAAGANRSDTFHVVIGHFAGCGWSVEQIYEHLRQFPDGIAGRYLSEGRLSSEIARSAGKYNGHALPLLDGWKAPEKIVEAQVLKTPGPGDDELDEPTERVDDELEDGELDEDEPLQPDPELSHRLYLHWDKRPGPLKEWLVKHLLPKRGTGLLSGQNGTGKTFVAFDLLVAALATGQPFLGHQIKRQCGVMLIAGEGEDEIELRLGAVLREKCGGIDAVPFSCWHEDIPTLLEKDAVKKIVAMARQLDAAMRAEFGLPLGLIVIDTVAACAGYRRSGEGNDGATGAAILRVFRAVARACNCFVLGIDHLGKNVELGTVGTAAKEDAADVVWILLGDKALTGGVTNTRLAVRKHRGGQVGEVHPFTLRLVEAPELDEDGEPYTTRIVDWQPAGTPGSAGPAPPPPDDPWIKGCRRDDQRAIMSRLKRVLLAALTEHGAEQPIPSKVRVKTSDPYIGDEVLTPSFDAPVVRMVDQRIVRELFDLHTPQDTRQARYERFKAARDRAEQLGLIGAGNSNDVTYLWLSRPDQEEDEGC